MLKELTKIKQNIKTYFDKDSVHAPYAIKPKDLPVIFTIIFFTAVVILAGIVIQRRTNLKPEAASNAVRFVDPETLQLISFTTKPDVGLLITAPWPVGLSANIEGGEVAGAIAQKGQGGSNPGGKKSPSPTPIESPTPQPTKEPSSPTPTPTDTPSPSPVASPTPTKAPSQTITSIELAEDSGFTQNLVTISPVDTNPLYTTYTFSNSTPGTKTIYAKFVSSAGTVQQESSSIDLVDPSATIIPTEGGIRPYPGAPLCPDSGSSHNNSVYHGLWDSERGCHYDHEHGQNPLNPEISTIFPGFNLAALTGGVTIGHTNPSSAAENTAKHGGFKWQFMPAHPETCAGFESSTNGVNGSLIEVHSFGNYNTELQGRIHSSLAMLRLCNEADPTDYGYLYTVQFQDYGQIISPYQGDLLAFPFQPSPAYNTGLGPYLTIDCVGQKAEGSLGACRDSRELVLSRRLDANSNWSSKPTGRANQTNPLGSTLFNVFFRLRDTYQLVDWNDQTYPLTFPYLCSADGGATYNPVGCRYNNSTLQVHEIAGRIPASWDNLEGFDTDPRVGRITAEGYTDRFGTLNRTCTHPWVGMDRTSDCFPVKMVNAFVGSYGSVLVYTQSTKGTNLVPYLPKKDIFFCNGVECNESDAGATPSGWIGPNN